MVTRGKKGSVLLPDTAGLNFGIWLDPSSEVDQEAPRGGHLESHPDEAPKASLAQQMEQVRKNWEHRLRQG